jgi:hypothetical protein
MKVGARSIKTTMALYSATLEAVLAGCRNLSANMRKAK